MSRALCRREPSRCCIGPHRQTPLRASEAEIPANERHEPEEGSASTRPASSTPHFRQGARPGLQRPSGSVQYSSSPPCTCPMGVEDWVLLTGMASGRGDRFAVGHGKPCIFSAQGVMRRLCRRHEVHDGADGARPNLFLCERLGQSSVDADLRTCMGVNKT
jgi:hypothetical protein